MEKLEVNEKNYYDISYILSKYYYGKITAKDVCQVLQGYILAKFGVLTGGLVINYLNKTYYLDIESETIIEVLKT